MTYQPVRYCVQTRPIGQESWTTRGNGARHVEVILKRMEWLAKWVDTRVWDRQTQSVVVVSYQIRGDQAKAGT